MIITKKILTVFITLFIATSLWAINSPNTADEQTVKNVVTEYAKSIDKQDLDALENIVYDDASFIMINKLRNNVSQYDKNELINLVKKGGMGGWERTLNIVNVQLSENTAVAKIEIADNKLKTQEFVTLIKVGDKWQIVGSAMSIDKL